MPEDYATKQDIKQIEERLWGHKPPLFDNDTGDIGHLKRDIEIIKTQQKEILDWKKRLSGVPAKFLMAVSFVGMLVAGLNGFFNLIGH